MSEKLLYYFGAGASAEALPLARSVGIPDSPTFIAGLCYALKAIDFDGISNRLDSEHHQNIVQDMKSRCFELSRMAEEFGDVDTYAKYLNLKEPGGQKLVELKRTLSDFFTLKQVVSKSVDKRYLPWLVSLMSKTIFPDNVKILSWNYDFQVELANEHIGQPEDIEHGVSSFIHSPSSLLHYPNLDPTFSDFNLLSLIHLNGIAGYTEPKAGFETASVFQKKFRTDLKALLDFSVSNPHNNLIHFAWEKNRYHAPLLDYVKPMIAGTSIMVVVGYSFPFFNREIDKVIFDQLKADNQFRKIYFQDPNLDGQQLKAQFNLPKDFEIVHIRKTDNFHIPFEY